MVGPDMRNKWENLFSNSYRKPENQKKKSKKKKPQGKAKVNRDIEREKWKKNQQQQRKNNKALTVFPFSLAFSCE